MLSEDYLGLDKIYIQAKRWENTVGRPEIQQFKGALADQVAKKVSLLQLPILVKRRWNRLKNQALF